MQSRIFSIILAFVLLIPDTDAQWEKDIISDKKSVSYAVAISDNAEVVVVSNPTMTVKNAVDGKVTVFKKTADSYTAVQQFHGAEMLDQFGTAVDISSNGTIFAVSAPDLLNSNPMVQVFEQTSEGTYQQLGGNITTDGKDNNFGCDIALSGDGKIIAVGAASVNNPSSFVKIFRYNSGNWELMGSMIKSEDGNHQTGFAVALSANGERLAVGEPHAADQMGQVRIFDWKNNTWQQTGLIKGTEGNEQMGRALCMNPKGTMLAVGSPLTQNGKAALYTWDGSSWNIKGKPFTGDSKGQRMGSSVAINADGTIMAVGAHTQPKAEGYTKVYKYQNDKWYYYVNQVVGRLDEYTGFSLDMTADGQHILIGYPEFENANLYSIKK